jgi:SDR family mycofactocin-dependent oxidoreductase
VAVDRHEAVVTGRARRVAGMNRRGGRASNHKWKESSMGRLDGKVAFITGGARGQGRSHAVRLAEEGADIVVVDSVGGVEAYPWMTYAMATKDDLAETTRMVEATGRGIVAREGDVRDESTLEAAVQEGLDKFGHIDIVSANAGISPFGPETWLNDDRQWHDVLDVNLLGVRNTVRAVVPSMIAAERGGTIVVTSSGAGLKGVYGLSDYCASKFAVIGLARSLANEVGPYNIRVNVIAPGTVDTDMVQNPGLYRAFRPDLENPGRHDVEQAFLQMAILKVPWVDPIDISNALLFLASDDARYITGQVLAVDAGMSVK